ncbi:hypothetical protein [Streptomyces sp. DSM 15324]|nr:hypothetical protein [Streptomyces sp. DSM 15324]
MAITWLASRTLCPAPGPPAGDERSPPGRRVAMFAKSSPKR